MYKTSRKPYENALDYESESFIVRVVEESDAEDLLECYSDPMSAPLFNSDNCTSNFVYENIEEIRSVIKFWLKEYDKGYYVRFALVDKARGVSIGTLEMFAKEKEFEDVGSVGVLRIDLASAYESKRYIDEIIELVANYFFDDFGVENIITKAAPLAQVRIDSLIRHGYTVVENQEISGQCRDYFIGTGSI